MSHKKIMPEIDCTAKCHQQNKQIKPGLSPLYYPDSVHGRAYLERGAQDAAKCWDCHTKHNIKRQSDLDSTVNKRNIPLTCSNCHEDMSVILKYNIHCEKPYQDYLQSVHGKALYKAGLLSLAAVCTDCHGIHDIKGVGEPSLIAKNPKTCGKCHILIFNAYKESIHGGEALNGNPDVPLCVDCHNEHKIIFPSDEEAPTSWKNVNDTCSACHARIEIMQKYGVPDDRRESYIQSLHGIAIGYGYEAAANCTSCHGFHDIRPASDPSSRVNPANLAKTCRQENCHPGMPDKISNSRIHIDINQKKSGASYYIQQIFLWIVFITAVITVIWFVPGFIKKIKYLKR
ncbi:MAG: cytochrome c3 family protein [Candidatus Aminicenantes bacterium]|nr:MAG: cytochrome c3 family protein [Candidatus Aminicenantes bacterium]